ncbi:MAG: OmpA family protein [Bacteroidales bacterium]|nr:OmpA family protein [Bacteroidales bacterium]
MNIHISAQRTCDVDISNKSRRYHEKGRKKYLDADFNKALEYLDKAIKESPENYNAHLLKAYININPQNRRGSIQSAAKSFKAVAEICPQADIKCYYYLGEIYYGREEWGKAAQYYDKFLTSDLEEQKRVTDNDFEHAQKMFKKARFNKQIFSNEVPFDPKPVKGVSTPLDEYLAIISPDHEKMFFTRKTKVQKRENVWDSGNSYTEEFMQASRKTDNVFTRGNAMDYPFNQEQNEGGATITIDNKDLYLTICKQTKDYYNCDICHSHFDGQYWTDIVNLGDKVNNDDTWESMPSITSDGNKIYFVSDRPGGYGGYDIYYTKKDSEGNWSKAINAGPAINTSGDESSPFIHTDSQTLYFSSRDRFDEATQQNYPGHKGLGGFDIFYIRLGEEEKMTEPKNIGYPINTEDDELGFFVSTDGSKGYFATNKYSAKGDYNIFYFDLYEEARPEKVLFIKGTLKDEENKQPIEDAKIELRNVESKKVTVVDVDDETGDYVAAMPFKSDYVMTVKSKKHVYQSRYISSKKPTYMNPANVDIELEPFKVGKSYKLNDIYFDTDSDSLTKESKVVLRDFVDYLKNNSNISIAVHGYTDNVGEPDYNLKLSKNRAKAVYDQLIKMGVSASRLKYEGFGEADPVADNSTEEGRAKNRRTEFKIIGL